MVADQHTENVLDCPCGHSIEDHPTTNRDYWTGDADSPCQRCGCLEYDGEGYPAHSDGRTETYREAT